MHERRLSRVVHALRDWQHDDVPFQLHPGDLGWFWRFGEAATDEAVRTWDGGGRLLAVGLLDGPGLMRLAIAPEAQQDEELARRLVADAEVTVAPPPDSLVDVLLGEAGWELDEPWTVLRRDLAQSVDLPSLRIEVVGPELVAERVAVQRAAFDNSTFTVERWHAMASGPAYADARCLVGYDERGAAVAAATVWSAGAGRPGILEPVGVHRDHRGRGHGTAISLAAAAALQELGASSAMVCTPTSLVSAVSTYRSAGFEAVTEVRDRRRRS